MEASVEKSGTVRSSLEPPGENRPLAYRMGLSVFRGGKTRWAVNLRWKNSVSLRRLHCDHCSLQRSSPATGHTTHRVHIITHRLMYSCARMLLWDNEHSSQVAILASLGRTDDDVLLLYCFTLASDLNRISCRVCISCWLGAFVVNSVLCMLLTLMIWYDINTWV